GDSHNNGKYFLYLTVTQPHSGGPNAIHEGEDLNPVKTLRLRYDAWRKTQPTANSHEQDWGFSYDTSSSSRVRTGPRRRAERRGARAGSARWGSAGARRSG